MARAKPVFDGKRAQLFRTGLGLTLDEVGSEIEVASHTVESWERKGKRPGSENLIALARLYGRRPEEFFSDAAPIEPGIALTASPDVPDELRREAFRIAQDLNRRYRELRERSSVPLQPRPPVGGR